MLEQHSTEGWAKQHSTIAATALAFDWAEESMLTGHANGRISLWDLEYAKGIN
jgi:hypothetical protein